MECPTPPVPSANLPTNPIDAVNRIIMQIRHFRQAQDMGQANVQGLRLRDYLEETLSTADWQFWCSLMVNWDSSQPE